jgi:major membrane immunogen (membrane-anchored lipoprotein)
MKRLFLISAMILALFLFGSCSKSDNGQRQIKIRYWTSIEHIDWYFYDSQVSNPAWEPFTKIPKDLYQKIKGKINDYTPVRKSFFITCDAEAFLETIEQDDAKIIACQKQIASNFENFYKKELEPLLNNKEAFGPGELSLEILIVAGRSEEDFETPGDNGKYEYFGSVNNQSIYKTFEPIVFEIKYKNPE